MEPPKRRKYTDTNEFRMKCIDFYRASDLSLVEASRACNTPLGDIQALGETDKIAARQRIGKKSEMIGTKRSERKPLSEDLEQ